MPLTLDQATALLQAGKITPDQYKAIAASVNPMTGQPMGTPNVPSMLPPQTEGAPIPPPPPAPSSPELPPNLPPVAGAAPPSPSPPPPPGAQPSMNDAPAFKGKLSTDGASDESPSAPEAPKAPKPAAQSPRTGLGAGDQLLKDQKAFADETTNNLERGKQLVQITADAERKKNEYAATAGEAAAREAHDQTVKDALRWQQAMQQADKLDEEARARSRAVDDTKVDPNRAWNNLSTGSKILAGISMLLGGFGAGASAVGKQPATNKAMDVINEAISRDIDAQKYDIANRREGVNAEMRINNSKTMRVQMDHEVRAATQLAAYNRVKDMISAKAAQFDSPAIQAKADDAINQIQQKQNEVKMQYAQQVYVLNHGKEQAAASAAASAAAQARKAEEEDLQFKRQVFLKQMDLQKKDEETKKNQTVKIPIANSKGEFEMDDKGFPKMTPVLAGSPKDAEELSKMGAVYGSLRQGIDHLIAARQSQKGGTFNPEDVADEKATSAGLIPQINEFQGLTRLSAEDIKLLRGLIPEDPSEHNLSGIVGQDPTLARLVRARKIIDDKYQSAINQRTAEGGIRMPSVDKQAQKFNAVPDK